MHKNVNIVQGAYPTMEALNTLLMKKSDTAELPKEAVGTSTWHLSYPCLADSLQFDYPRLCTASYASKTPFGVANGKKSVAVLGAGISGTQATRELIRAGYNVLLIEASDRIGGRTYSMRAVNAAGGAQLTALEAGAMRIPFFSINGVNITEKQGAGPHPGGPFHSSWQQTGPRTPSNMTPVNSMAEWKALFFNISTLAFPDPGKAPLKVGNIDCYPGVNTRVYVNDGWGVDLVTLYEGQTSKWNDPTNMPSATFSYDWPANPSSQTTITFPPNPLPDGTPSFEFYNRGTPCTQYKNVYGTPSNPTSAPQITLNHPIPDTDDYIPTNFGSSSSPDYAKNVAAWKQGIFALRSVLYKWTIFAKRFAWAVSAQGRAPGAFVMDGLEIESTQASLSMMYDGTNWTNFWFNSIMPYYQNVNFYEVAVAAPILPTQKANGKWQVPSQWLQGNFGGLGLSGQEAQLFYTMGAGDGSWGAFFPLSSLWALRALLFGYADAHQLILGALNPTQTNVDETLLPTPDQSPFGVEQPTPCFDSLQQAFRRPQFTGVNSFAEMNLCYDLDSSHAESFYAKAAGNKHKELKDVFTNGSAALYMKTKVTSIKRINGNTDGGQNIQIGVSVNGQPSVPIPVAFNYVLCTIPIWNTETDLVMEGFGPSTPSGVPLTLSTALDVSHWIRSAKVFVILNQAYFADNEMAQVFATNTELQDWYSYRAVDADTGVALISYTWEQDSSKLLSYTDQELTLLMMQKCNEVLQRAGLKNQDGSFKTINQYMIDPTLAKPGSFFVWRWTLEKNYHGCARANQTGIENLASLLLTWNSNDNAKNSQLYFSGDAYSQESGWLEPALRLGTDAALNIINNDDTATMSTFGGTFNFATDYFVAPVVGANQAQNTKTLGFPSAQSSKLGASAADEAGCNCTVA